MTKKFLTLGLLPLVLSSLAFGQEAQYSPTNTAPKAAPAARLVGGGEIVTLKNAQDMATQDMVLPYDRSPVVQYRSSKDFFAQYPDRSKTPSGLYVLDSELVPQQLPEILARTGLATGQDGSKPKR